MRHSMHSTLVRATAASTIAACVMGCSDPGDTSSEPTRQESTALRPSGRDGAVLPRLPTTPTSSASTVPVDGDVNPYGVAFVPTGFPATGSLRAGDLIVANFNDSANLQGTGTTIVRVNPGDAGASPSLFFQDAQAQGFSTALGVIRQGFVLVGNVPSTDGSGACTGNMDNVGQGGVLVIDAGGNLVRTLQDAKLLAGPWDMLVEEVGALVHVFVSNVLTGTVTRIDTLIDTDDDDDGDDADGAPRMRMTQIASGYAHRCDPSAFVVGPTGLALDRERDVLYVAATGDNAIFAVEGAVRSERDRGMGRKVVDDAAHLHGPVGLVRAPNGDLIAAQGDAVNPDPAQPSEIVEFTAQGRFVSEFSIDPSPGSAFGLALKPTETGFRFAAVDDGQNVLDTWEVR